MGLEKRDIVLFGYYISLDIEVDMLIDEKFL